MILVVIATKLMVRCKKRNVEWNVEWIIEWTMEPAHLSPQQIHHCSYLSHVFYRSHSFSYNHLSKYKVSVAASVPIPTD